MTDPTTQYAVRWTTEKGNTFTSAVHCSIGGVPSLTRAHREAAFQRGNNRPDAHVVSRLPGKPWRAVETAS